MIHLEKGLKYLHGKTSVPNSEEFAKFCCKNKPNKMSFRVQDGAIKDAGVNGIQASDLLNFVYGVFASLNGDFPCRENLVTLDALQHAIQAQEDRTTNRIKRGVEGTENA